MTNGPQHTPRPGWAGRAGKRLVNVLRLGGKARVDRALSQDSGEGDERDGVALDGEFPAEHVAGTAPPRGDPGLKTAVQPGFTAGLRVTPTGLMLTGQW